jgi:chromosomal replication initiator protein
MDPVWTESLHALKQQLGQHEFKTWFVPLRVVERTRNEVVLQAPNAPFATWVTSHYLDRIAQVMEEVAGRSYRIRVVADEEPPPAAPGELEAEAAPAVHSGLPGRWGPGGTSTGQRERAMGRGATPASAGRPAPGEQVDPRAWNARFTFETYVVGPSNQLAHAACRAVAARPGQAYNPLYLHGWVGLGKTHLLHATGQAIARDHPGLRVAYLTAERLAVEFGQAVRFKRAGEFRERLRGVDVLLVDDVQFLARKKATQEELFHTFNALHERARQIVLASDRPAREIPTLEERLRSRFEMGLIADLQPPDLETKVAILKSKAAFERVDLKDEVARFIASKIGPNIRKLEGVAVRLAAHQSLSGTQITPEVARKVLLDVIGSEPQSASIDDVQRVVAQSYQLEVADLTSSRREGNVVGPRHVAMYLCRLVAGASFPEIGRQFGGRNHATVISACQNVEGRLKEDRSFKEEVENLVYAIQTR